MSPRRRVAAPVLDEPLDMAIEESRFAAMRDTDLRVERSLVPRELAALSLVLVILLLRVGMGW